MKFKKFLTANKISSFMYTKYCKLDLGGRMFFGVYFILRIFICDSCVKAPPHYGNNFQ